MCTLRATEDGWWAIGPGLKRANSWRASTRLEPSIARNLALPLDMTGKRQSVLLCSYIYRFLWIFETQIRYDNIMVIMVCVAALWRFSTGTMKCGSLPRVTQCVPLQRPEKPVLTHLRTSAFCRKADITFTLINQWYISDFPIKKKYHELYQAWKLIKKQVKAQTITK